MRALRRTIIPQATSDGKYDTAQKTKNKDLARAAVRNQHNCNRRQTLVPPGQLVNKSCKRRCWNMSWNGVRAIPNSMPFAAWMLKTSHAEENRGANSVQLVKEITTNFCLSHSTSRKLPNVDPELIRKTQSQRLLGPALRRSLPTSRSVLLIFTRKP